MEWHEIFRKILIAEKPGDELARNLIHNPWGAPLFLAEADRIPAGPLPWHNGSTLKHMSRCMNETAGDPLAVWLAMCHDAGKLTTPKKILPHHYGHEVRGELLAPIWAKQLRLEKSWAKAGALASRQHMRAAHYPFLRPGKKHSLLLLVENAGIADSFWKMVDADSKSHLSAWIMPHREAIAKWQKENLPETKQIELLAQMTDRSTYSRQ